MGDSTKRIMLAAALLLVLACVIWYVFLRDNGASKVQQSQVPQTQQSTTAKASKDTDTHTNTAALQQTPITPAPVTNQPAAILPAAPATPAIELITGDIEAEKDVFKEPYIKRSRPIAINAQLLEKDGKLVPGARIALTLFSDAKYAVTVQQVNRGPQGDFSANCRLDGEEYGTVTLSAAGGVVLMRLADPTAKKLFLIRCHGADRVHYVVEVEPAKVPVPKHGDAAGVKLNK